MSTFATNLRQSYLRACSLSLDEQLRECVDQLEHPELITSELIQAHAAVACELESASGDGPQGPSPSQPRDQSRHFYPTRDIFVLRDSSSFTCLANDIVPLSLAGIASAQHPETGHDGLDYVAVTCTREPQPVLGAVQSEQDRSAYPLLLRLLACFCELAHPVQADRIDRQYFHGMLGESPTFDLHLILWDDWREEDEPPERTPISQLTHDLAELAKAALQQRDSSPPMLRDILCLQMNPTDFDARVRFDWRV